MCSGVKPALEELVGGATNPGYSDITTVRRDFVEGWIRSLVPLPRYLAIQNRK
jgi:hypothetical protein